MSTISFSSSHAFAYIYEACVNTNSSTYNSIRGIQACKYNNRNKGIYSSFFSITFTCAVLNFMFNSGKFCDSAADHNRVKEKWRKSVFASVSETIWLADIRKLMTYKVLAANINNKKEKKSIKLSQRCAKFCQCDSAGEAKSKPWAYYIVIVGVCFHFVFLLLLFVTGQRCSRWKRWLTRLLHFN